MYISLSLNPQGSSKGEYVPSYLTHLSLSLENNMYNITLQIATEFPPFHLYCSVLDFFDRIFRAF